MAIEFLRGKPGSGKSYEAVRYHFVPSLVKKEDEDELIEVKSKLKPLKNLFKKLKKRKKEQSEARYIVTNLPINLDYLEEQGYDTSYVIKLTKENLGREPFTSIDDFTNYDQKKVVEGGKGTLFIIDECHKALPYQRGVDPKYKTILKQLEEWFAEHRHAGNDVILISQHYDKVDKKILIDVERTKHMRSLRNKGKALKHTYLVFFKQEAADREYDYYEVRKYDPYYFPFYNSFTKGGNGIADFNDHRAVWQNWKFYLSVIFIISSIVFIVNKKPWDVLGNAKVERQSQTEDQQLRDEAVRAAQIASVSSPVSSPVVSLPSRVEVCEHFLDGYTLSYVAQKDDDDFYFHIYKVDANFNDLLSASQLYSLGYRLEDIFYENLKRMKYLEIYFNYEKYEYENIYRETAYSKADFFSARIIHRDCEDYSQVITHLKPVEVITTENNSVGPLTSGGTDFFSGVMNFGRNKNEE